MVRTLSGKSTSYQCPRAWYLLGAGQQPLAASAPRGHVFHFAILLPGLVFLADTSDLVFLCICLAADASQYKLSQDSDSNVRSGADDILPQEERRY